MIYYTGLTALGLIVGYSSGLFGVGGGFMVTPMLVAVFGVNPTVAVGSSLAQMIAVGSGAAWRHGKAGFVDVKLVLAMSPGVLAGTYLGKALLDWLNKLGNITLAGYTKPLATVVLSGLFVLLLIGIATRFWREQPEEKNPAATWLNWPNGPWPMSFPICGIEKCSLLALLPAGVLIGFMAGLMGIGGGIILTPLLVYGFGVSLRMAIGSSSLLILVSALSGTLQYALAGQVDIRIVLALIVGSSIGVQIGAWHSHRLHIAHLQRAFAILVMVVAAIIVARFFA